MQIFTLALKRKAVQPIRLVTITPGDTLPKLFTVDLREALGWSGNHTFRVTLELEPAPSTNGYSATYELDWIAVRSSGLVVGGRGLVIGTGSAELLWSPGNAQANYVIHRIAGESKWLPPDGPLPPNATGYIDTQVNESDIYCYIVIPLDGGGTVLGNSDIGCAIPGTKAGTLVPDAFKLRSSETSIAALEWTAPSGSVNGYALITIPLDGSTVGVLPIQAVASRTIHNTGGIPTCYLLVAVSDTETGNSDILCSIPGVARFEMGSEFSTVADRASDAAARLMWPR